MSEQELLFNAAAMIYLKKKNGLALPSIDTSYVGNTRITLRSADGALLGHVSMQRARKVLTSGTFGDLDDNLSSLVKSRVEQEARAKEEKTKKINKMKDNFRSLLRAPSDNLRIKRIAASAGQSKRIKAVSIGLGGVGTVLAINFISLQAPLNSVISSDSRNAGVRASARYQWMVNPNVMIFSIDEALEASPADVSRILLQYAERLEERKFSSVLLARRGKPVFMLKGDYFKQIGEEYGAQNVIYTLRTMPENVYELDGSPAFSSWSGGWLGVVGKQFEDLSTFYSRWLVE